MKKTLILGILGLAASAVTSFGQGQVVLYNYTASLQVNSANPQLVKYGAGSGGTVGAGVNNSFTAALYIASVTGDNHTSFSADPTGIADPATLYTGTGTFAAATGAGSTAQIANANVFGLAGQYAAANSYAAGLGQGVTVTVMIVAYNGTSYTSANTTDRGHSAAFTMTTSIATANPNLSGDSESDGGFSVHPVPEPSVLALSGLGAAALMAFRRKKQA